MQTSEVAFWVIKLIGAGYLLWLGIKVERSLGDRVAMRQLADQLHKRFPDSKEWQRFERGAFDD